MTMKDRHFTSRDDFPAELPDKKVMYCWTCKYPGVTNDKIYKEKYRCMNCGNLNERCLIFDPQMRYSFDEKGRLAHYGGGIFILNDRKETLFFLRRRFPYLLTIPGGHMVFGEDPYKCAMREVKEEVNIKIVNAEKIFEGFLEGDECVGGADIHYWYLYKSSDYKGKIKLDEEGSKWEWFDIKNIDLNKLTYPVRYFLEDEVIRNKLLED